MKTFLYIVIGLTSIYLAWQIYKFARSLSGGTETETDPLSDMAFQRMQEANTRHQESCKGKPKSRVFCCICGGKVSDPDNAVLLQAIKGGIRNFEEYYDQFGVQHLFVQFDENRCPTCPGSKSRATKMNSLLTERARRFYKKFWKKLSEKDRQFAKPLKFEDDPTTLALYERAKRIVGK